tara:strand:- start:3560 stop:4075 length:516 start_codon:yes stop_codon:yes gene_type:complete
MGKEKLNPIEIFGKPELLPQGAYQITHHAYVDLVPLLKSISEWLNRMEYTFFENGITEKPFPTGQEVESKWMAERNINDYIQFKMQFVVHARDVKNVVLEDGRETQWARVVIYFSSWFIKNYNDTYSSSNWGEWMRQLYERYVIKDELGGYEGKLFIESMDLIKTMKSYLH